MMTVLRSRTRRGFRLMMATRNEERPARNVSLVNRNASRLYPPWSRANSGLGETGVASPFGPFDSTADGNASVINYSKARSIIFYARARSTFALLPPREWSTELFLFSFFSSFFLVALCSFTLWKVDFSQRSLLRPAFTEFVLYSIILINYWPF